MNKFRKVIIKTIIIIVIGAGISVCNSVKSYAYILDDQLGDELANVESISSYPDDCYAMDMAAVLPEKYVPDCAKELTAPRDQGIYGICWANTAVFLAEASLISQGKADASIDFSELALAYSTWHGKSDPLNGILGDVNSLSDNKNWVRNGGSILLGCHVLENWRGASNENLAPISKIDEACANPQIMESFNQYEDEAHVRQIYRINLKEDPEAAKQVILENGAISLSYYAEQPDSDYEYYDSEYNSFYCNERTTTNHSVAICGWDDCFPKDNFKGENKPARDGAWLVRNSWYRDGDELFSYRGYFWISYCDTSLSNSLAMYFDYAGNYENNYQYDGGIKSFAYKQDDMVKCANIFEAKAKSGTNKIKSDTNISGELLKAVSFETSATNENYLIEIYLNPESDNPESGTKLAQMSGMTSFEGYYIVQLESPMYIEEGEKFSVVITLTKSGAKASIDLEGDENSWYTIRCSANQGQSFMWSISANKWIDFGKEQNRNIRIKAFTNNVLTNAKESFVIDDSAGTSDDSSGNVSHTSERLPGFVNRLYTVALGRDSDVMGKRYWTAKLISKELTGADVVAGFIFSEEFKNRNLSDSDFVDLLYRTMFNRESDEEGKANWMNALENGMSREYVYRGFAESKEFEKMCEGYSISQGTYELTQNRDQNEQLTAFVAHNYTKALGRAAEEAGINDWTGRILKGESTPADVTAGFIFSPEFVAKDLSDEDFLKVLYQTYFDREPDSDGYNKWLEKLISNEVDREYVVNTGFSCSEEFANLVAGFGL